MEVIDLENPTNTCNLLADYPADENGMTVGLIDGLIKSCAGLHDTDDCYDYNPATNSWINSTSLKNARKMPRSSFIDGIWLISGDDDDEVDDVPQTTEIWTGTGFEPGPLLPIPMYSHCQLTINATHVYFADSRDTGKAYLLDWFEQKWTELPSMTIDRDQMSCGLINNPENGIEVVIVEDGVTEIFNFRENEWKSGPVVEYFDEASSAQIGDTFVVVGGENYAQQANDRIYRFDHINYEWIYLSQRLQVARESNPGVVAVPDDFVTCS